MALVRILQGISGADFSWYPGEVVDLDEEEAAKWADGYRAELVDDGPPPPPPDPDDPDDQEPETDPDEDEPFDPIVHVAKDVLAYLAEVGEEEAVRVLDLEAEGENRKGIASQRNAVLEGARARDAKRAEEVAAETSRGGGRGEGIETR